ncbi:competence protein CoiA [Chitinophaga barathri]|uniref:Competence protein n=1 Tax=Chitinophaga barathri TaxID=1647451 RepID=A0A3N4MGT2_9BACT|nr:competence protein CoiA family protein [Chitinophaga barathri]RPD39300.1 competence protein [Chitinophaga barathri]
MRFALIDNLRVEANPGLKGICPGCGQPVLTKCGTIRVHHWAHQRTELCDSWGEPETEWHRSWKNNFPHLWQECFMRDVLTGEKHMADVRTDHGLVIEFQHSHLKPQERIARENFYRDLVWIVDGTRLVNDFPRFLKGQNQIQPTGKSGIFHVYDPAKCFPSAWLSSSVPVLFDFLGGGQLNNPLDSRNQLYCLFPIKVGRRATLARIPRSAFIKTAINGDWSVRVTGIMKELLKGKEDWDNQEEIIRSAWQLQESEIKRFSERLGYGKGRRF